MTSLILAAIALVSSSFAENKQTVFTSNKEVDHAGFSFNEPQVDSFTTISFPQLRISVALPTNYKVIERPGSARLHSPAELWFSWENIKDAGHAEGLCSHSGKELFTKQQKALDEAINTQQAKDALRMTDGYDYVEVVNQNKIKIAYGILEPECYGTLFEIPWAEPQLTNLNPAAVLYRNGYAVLITSVFALPKGTPKSDYTKYRKQFETNTLPAPYQQRWDLFKKILNNIRLIDKK
jgi:hypothetical protein